MSEFRDTETIALVAVAIERSGMGEGRSDKEDTSSIHDRFINMLLRKDVQLNGVIRECQSLKDQLATEKKASVALLKQRDEAIEKARKMEECWTGAEDALSCAQEHWGAAEKRCKDLQTEIDFQAENTVSAEVHAKLAEDHKFTVGEYEALQRRQAESEERVGELLARLDTLTNVKRVTTK